MPASSGRLVALELPPGAPLAEAIIDRWDAGDAVLPLPPDEDAARRVLEAARPHVVRDGHGERELDDPAPVDPDVVLVVATSGTTSRPRAVELTESALGASARAGLDRIGAREDDRWLACLPLHHVAGVLVLVRSRLLGTEPVVHARFDPQAVAEAAVTHVSLVPTMLVRLLDAGVGRGDLRRVLLGGAPAPPGLLQRAALAGVPVTETYGMTETCGGCVYDGLPLDGVTVELEDPDDEGVGRIVIGGPVVASGYRLGRRFGGRFLSRDLGRWTGDGRLEVLGRTDDVIVTGGVNVAGGEVARTLAEHPAIRDVVVHGRPDPEWSERVVAFVVPVDPLSPPTLEELRAHVSRTMPRESAPRELVLVEELPRSDLGKVRRSELPGADDGERASGGGPG